MFMLKPIPTSNHGWQTQSWRALRMSLWIANWMCWSYDGSRQASYLLCTNKGGGGNPTSWTAIPGQSLACLSALQRRCFQGNRINRFVFSLWTCIQLACKIRPARPKEPSAMLKVFKISDDESELSLSIKKILLMQGMCTLPLCTCVFFPPSFGSESVYLL